MIDLRNLDKDKIFFTSDPHFCHDNIIKYCERPFEDSKIMNQVLTEKWNNVVPEDGIVFVIGDFIFKANTKTVEHIMYRLNGKIVLIRGNHDRAVTKKEYTRGLFDSIHEMLEISIKDREISGNYQKIIMCHYPMIVWNHSHRGSWQLFGHVHGGLSNKGFINHKSNQLDVGVDSHNYKPLSYEDVKILITKQNLK